MINPRVRFKNDNGNDYPDWGKCIVDDVFVERNESHLITDDAPQLSFTIEQGVIYPEDKKTNKRDFLIKDKSSKKFLLTEYNDIIYNPANLKFGAIHRNKLGRGVVSPIYTIFKTDQDPVFMEYLVRNPRFIKRSLKYLEGTVIKLMTLKPRDFVKMKISVPCIEEQKKISDFLSKIDALISISEEEVNKYKELKKGCMQTMFPRGGADVPEVRFPGFTDAWEQRKLGDEAIEILAGGDIDKEKATEEGKYPIYANALTNDGIVGYYDDYYRVKAPAVTVTGRGEVGHAQARMTDFTPVVRLLAIRSNHDCYFLENAINNHKVIVESTGVPQLTVPQLSSYEIFFPSNIEEETKIGEYFHSLDNLITLHQRECEKYRKLKAGLLQKMFV